MASVVKSPASPSRVTNNMTTTTSISGAAVASTTPLDLADDDDLDPAAFLQSVRELSAKREREDNERFRKLEEEIEKGRQERLARRAEYARSLSPEKRDSVTQSTARSSHALPSRPSSMVAPVSYGVSTPKATPSSTTTSASTPVGSSPVGVEEVPEFSGFGSARKAAIPAVVPATIAASPTPSPVSKPSPSAAMPGRAGSVKWQQRPAGRIGGARPLSMVAIENAQAVRTPETPNSASIDEEPSRADIAKSLGSRDPSWFRQTQDRGVGNAAYRKNAEEVGAGDDMARTGKLGLPGLAKETSSAASQRFNNSAIEAPTLIARDTPATPRLDRSPSPTKELGGFVQSAMLKRNNSITKRSAASPAALDRTATLRSGFGGLQGSQSMPKLEQPAEPAASSTDTLPRTASSMSLADGARAHARAKSITSAYTINDHDRVSSAPSSPGKRWSPNKSSWIENALIAKPDSRPASPSKNSQPSWMSDLAKSNAAKASLDATALERSTASSTSDAKQITAEPLSMAPGQTSMPKADVAVSIAATDLPKSKPLVSPKPQIDFRSTLKPRAATEPVPQEQPEFLSRFGTLRKTTTEKYVAPDTLKNNILRGKAGLVLTDGPQKTQHRDEFKDSLLAKKEQWRHDKQDGVSYERKTAAPTTPTKPEALMKREAMSRGGTMKAQSPEKEKQTTPEALKRHHTIRAKPAATIPVAGSNIIADVSTGQRVAEPAKPMTFNSQLAGLLARGPAAPPTVRQAETRPAKVSADSSNLGAETSRGKEEPLQDMRKGRAKGPKRRKAGTTMTTTADEEDNGDSATILDTSRSTAISSPAIIRSTFSPKPATSAKPSMMLKERAPLGWDEDKTQSGAVPDFKGFSVATKDLSASNDEDKENKSAILLAMPSPSLKDEEAAMRSAKLLASVPRSPALNGLGISGGPPKPAKSSRSVSGQLQEASLNKVFPRFPSFRRESNSSTASTPRTTRIDARAVFTRRSTADHDGRTIRKVLYQLAVDGKITIVSPRDEYTLCEDGIYLFLHIRVKSGGNLTTDVYTWIGRCAPHEHTYNLKIAQRALSSEHKSAAQHTIRQGRETEAFLAAMGGILVTKASVERSTQPYMLCGRKHLGQLVFDQVECKPEALCSAFVYVVCSSVGTIEDTIYVWQGSYCSPEEVSAARLIAMDLSPNGNVVEVRDSEEISDFWKAFGDWPMREDALTCPEVLKSKLKAGNAYQPRLFKLEKQEMKPGFFTTMLTRRPSWGTRSPALVDVEIRYEARELSPLIQADLDADGVYVLDSYIRLDVLIGPTSTATSAEDGLYQHTMHFVEDYVDLCIETGRPKPQCFVVNGGVPMHIPFLFRHWKYEHGLWGTAGLMAGLMHDKSDAQCLILQDALSALQEKTLLEDPAPSEDKDPSTD